jgi:large subunit ribosomal protein L10
MNRNQKEQVVQELQAQFNSSQYVAFVDYRGITVDEVDQVRRSCEAKEVRYLVAKNTLIRKAVQDTEKEPLVDAEFLSGMTGVFLSGEDGVAAAKVLRELEKEFNKKGSFEIKGGFFDGEVLNAADAIKVADFLGRDDLLALLLRTIQEGPKQIVGAIQAPARDLLFLLRNYENKLSEAGE